MRFDIEVLKSRVGSIREALYEDDEEGNRKPRFETLEGAKQGTLTVLEAVYGTDTRQVQRFVTEYSPLPSEHHGYNDHRYTRRVARLIDNLLQTAIHDIEAGLLRSVVASAKGEVLGDLTALSRFVLEDGEPMADRSASVLAAAALEDTLKQLGELNGVSLKGRDLRGSIAKLKDAGILAGPQASVAEGFVEFRNKALHGELEKIERESTLAVLSFVETLVAKHFE